MSHWEVWEVRESLQSHCNYDTKTLCEYSGMPAGTSLTEITSELFMFNGQPGGVTGQISPFGISCTSTTILCPQSCAWCLWAEHHAVQGCPSASPACALWALALETIPQELFSETRWEFDSKLMEPHVQNICFMEGCFTEAQLWKQVYICQINVGITFPPHEQKSWMSLTPGLSAI